MQKKPLLVILGPTAVGKTEVAIEVARKLDCEIISADSMQIYRHMDIGTAKPSRAEQKGVKHHMIDVVDPDHEFSVADFQSMAKQCMEDIRSRHKTPLISGGTGLYVNSVCYNYTFSESEKDAALREQLKNQALEYGNEFLYTRLEKLDPEAAKKIHPNNLRRIIRALEVCIRTGNTFSSYEEKTKKQKGYYDLFMFGLTRPRDELYRRINERVLRMIDNGLVEEVKKLLEMGYSRKLNSMQGLGYRQITDYLDGKITLDEAICLISRDTRHYAKRQYTWFLRDKNIVWMDVSREGIKKVMENIIKAVEGKLKNS